MHISSFSVSGYRSLKDVKITGMLPVCIFHGLNNTGKSNILSVLETIFRRKLRTEETTAVTEVLKQERRGNIWQGRITNFRDNFYKNGKEDIDFTVSITFADSELDFLREPLKQLKPYLAKPSYEKVLILDGKIRYFDDESADMLLDRAVFNNKDHVVFEVDESGKKSFFPKLTTLNAGQSLAYFEELMNLLADSFALLPADRYLTIEQELDESKGEFVLTPK